MPNPTTRNRTNPGRHWAPTQRGRIRATMIRLERDWGHLSGSQQERCLELLASLGAALRQERVGEPANPA